MRFAPRQVFTILFIVFFLTALAGGLLWANLNFVRKTPGGANFFVLWQGTRNFTMQGSLPYEDLTSQVKGFVYGPKQTGEPLPHFSLPLYLVFFYIPFALVNDPLLACAIWMVFLEFALFRLVFWIFRVIRWKPAWFYLMFLVLFAAFWAPTVSALLSGSTVIFQVMLLFGALRAIEFQADEGAGALLALAWFDLEATGLLIALVLFWALSLRRWRIWGGFLMATFLLLGISILFNFSWPLPFLGAIIANWRAEFYPSTFSMLETWLPGIGVRLAQGLTLATALMLIMEWRAARGKELRWLLWTLALTAAATPLLGMPFSPVWSLICLPALLIVLSIMDQRWGVFGRWSAALLFLVVFVGLWAAFLSGNASAFVFVFPTLLVFLLYWVRWWAVRTPKLWVDVISDLGK